MFTEGQKVSYVGDPSDGLDIGDVGLVVQAGHTASDVKWQTGGRAGAFERLPHHEITPLASTDRSDIDLLSGPIVNFKVQSTFDQHGAKGVLSAMRRQGHLTTLDSIGQQAMALVVTSLRQDPSFREALSYLDDQDGDDLVHLAAVALLRDAMAGE